MKIKFQIYEVSKDHYFFGHENIREPSLFFSIYKGNLETNHFRDSPYYETEKRILKRLKLEN